MSAWVVSKRHIDLLVKCIVRSEIVPEAGTDLNEIGRTLWEENHRSVNYRYNEHTSTPQYTFADIELPADAAYLIKQVGFYQYQTCEHEEWEQSKAYAWTQWLREMWHEGLGDDYHSQPAYQAAPWGIDDDYPAARR